MVNNIDIKKFFDKYIDLEQDIAVGVSGGADSMALCFALSECFSNNKKIHALTVDHGLRDESNAESQYVADKLKNLTNVTHHILKWEHDSGNKPDARIQEKARNARYNLMARYMMGLGITHLFLGHHMNDQAETFLFRLAKGSGIDGLSCMLPIQKMDNGIILCRPMLGVQKSEIIDFCSDKGISFIDDPSNECDDYARVRLRKSMDILSAEGLSTKRLAVNAMRHARARSALGFIADRAFIDCLVNKDAKRIVFDSKGLVCNPEEIILRVILRAVTELKSENGYGARMEKMEALCFDFINAKQFRKQTLGGVIFERKDDKFIMSLENPT